ncbi:DUF2911 domain-containing protein [Maribacter aestuarii]|uniref:DUF2911 domain-containing protein n=1 Tax=Maribacter aestuarii TaxID=1130723 RepID=UPI00248C6E09|nr:DUF2911 domain-containing protein [Maribacter aestuarii]
MKFLKRFGIVVIVLGALFYFIGMPYLKKQTKKNSPEKTANYTLEGAELSVNYSSPSKKDRVIFGELVPYGQVWRTGANEPTTFSNSAEIMIIDKSLPAGKYSLWTIPGKESWKIIYNKEIPEWGVTLLSGGKETTRDFDKDVLQVEVPVKPLPEPVENFTIDFKNEEQLYLTLSWDKQKVSIPINK